MHPKRTLVEQNRSQRSLKSGLCIHHLIEANAQSRPDALALVHENNSLTYRQLNERSNQLAHRLIRLGVGPEVMVAVCTNRSPDTIIALLGILKAGGAYVPLDPDYPQERLSYIMRDAEASILLTQRKLLVALPKTAAHSICIDTDSSILATESTSNLTNTVVPGNLAYVIYTSGSTGASKGVEIQHSSLLNFASFASTAYEIRPSDRVLQFASMSFDTSAEEIYPCLSNGGTLVLRTDSMIDTVPQFLQKCGEWGITVLDLPTAYWHELTARILSDKLSLPQQIRLVIIGGERALPERIADWNRCVPKHVRLFNTYGPTEGTVVATWCELSRNSTGFSTSDVSIGVPIPNTKALVLNESLKVVAVDVPGELHLGGEGLARGYLKRPELTAERFIPDPFSKVAGARLYKTGDLVRRRQDGSLEFLGRIDHQVKIRGFRVELGEIEAILNQHSAIKETIVLAREDEPGEKRLVAYFVPWKQPAPSFVDLRNFLKRKLPYYMIPAAFIVLDRMPLNTSGKVDRTALPAPDWSRLQRTEVLVLPQSSLEKALAGIWSELLRVQEIGVNDNFLELGGHSLLATQLISRVREVFQVDLTMRGFLELPTINALSKIVLEKGKDVERIALLLVTLARITDSEAESWLVDNSPLLFSPSGISGESNFELSPKKYQVFKALLEKNGIQSNQRQRILPHEGSESTLHSFSLWYVDQLDPGTSAFNIPEGLRIKGKLDVPALECSLDEIIRRHGSLRTIYKAVDGQPFQRILPVLKVPLKKVDLRNFPDSERVERARVLVNEEAERPFDLSKGPLLGLTLYRLGEDDHILLLVIHHIVSDGWSVVVFFRELAEIYEEFSRGNPSPLPELEIQYSDFAYWHRGWLQNEVLSSQLEYWKKQLGGNRALLEMPTDYPRPLYITYQGATESFVLPPSVTEALRNLSRDENVTLFMTLLAIFKVLLHRYTGQNDLIVGSPISGRNWVETEKLIGFFINTLVLRTNLSGNPTFRELLSRVREVALGAYANQEVPFEKLVEELNPERTVNRPPFFEVMFVLQNTLDQVPSIQGLDLSLFEVRRDTSMFDITLEIIDSGDKLKSNFNYRTDLFEASTIKRMVKHFETLIDGIVRNPASRLSDLPILTDPERIQILEEWNSTAYEYPETEGIHHLFESQAQLTPQAIAIEFQQQSLTYDELDARSNKLANYLKKCGVGPEMIVGIFLDRSIEMAISILAVLKAGGAYVPLDPAHPRERLSFILSNSGTHTLLTKRSLVKYLPEREVHQICLDRDWGAIELEKRDNPASRINKENLAYVIYTSGSTGEPKGVQVSHGALLNHCFSMKKRYALQPHDRVLQFAPFSFDVSIEELFPTWAAGAALVMRPSDISLKDFLDFMEKERITVVNLPAPYWHEWVNELEHLEIKIPPSVRLVIAGSEKALLEKYEIWREIIGKGVKWCNAYGPTEATITATIYEPDKESTLESVWTVPIGRPIDNVQCFILDSYGHPVPVGVTGELYIGGAGLARNYLGLPSLTAQKFIPDFFTGKTGSRIYKTGDLCRYLADGKIEILGRVDQQVKIRGLRIELGEIESILAKHPAVSEAVVVLKEEERTGDKHLVAYVALVKSSQISEEELKRYVRTKVPEYMVPSAFVVMDSLPVTPAGKIDYRALPEASRQGLEHQKAFISPRDVLELQLTMIWERILGIQSIGVTANFFELGGHSLTALRLFSQIQKTFGKNLPLSVLFQAPTIEQLAEILRQEGWTPTWSSLVPIQPGGSKPPFFCVHEVAGDVFNYRDLARHLGSDQPFYGLQAQGLHPNLPPHTRVEEMAKHYIEEIRSLQPKGPYYIGGSSFGGLVAFEMFHLLQAMGERVAFLALFDTYGPGYPRYIPKYSTSWRRSLNRFIRRVELHLENLYRAERATGILYLLPELSYAKKISEKLYFGNSHPLTPTLRVIHDINKIATDEYNPRTITGRVNLFVASKQPLGIYTDPALGWGGYAAAGVEIHIVPGQHGSMVQEPRVRDLAKALSASLQKAQAQEAQKS